MDRTSLYSKSMIRYMDFFTISIMYFLSSIIYYSSNVFGGVILITSSILFLIYNVKVNKTILDLYTLFLFSWLLTLGLSMLQLLGYQKEWKFEFFLITYLGIISMIIGLSLGKKISLRTHTVKKNLKVSYNTVIIATAISLIMFIISFTKTGIIPLFSNNLTAYHDHYTRYYLIQVGMLPSAGLAFYVIKTFRLKRIQKMIMYLTIFIHLIAFPILYITRGVFVAGIFFTLPLLYYFSENKKKFLRLGVLSFLFLIIIITSSRNYSNEEVDFFFQPKTISFMGSKHEIPDNLAMVYGYLTISHDNFNHNLGQLNNFSYGSRLIEPFEVFMSTDIFSDLRLGNRLENITFGLNTHNMMGIIYYDFGVAGVIIIMFIYGLFFGIIEKIFKKSMNPFNALAYGGVVIVVAVGFFTAWTTQFTLWMWWGTTWIFWMVQPKISNNKYSS